MKLSLLIEHLTKAYVLPNNRSCAWILQNPGFQVNRTVAIEECIFEGYLIRNILVCCINNIQFDFRKLYFPTAVDSLLCFTDISAERFTLIPQQS